MLNFPLRYGVKDMKTSAKRIYEAAIGAPEDHLVIILAHNGPTGAAYWSMLIKILFETHSTVALLLLLTWHFRVSCFAGLGSRADDICGKDWDYGDGDYGDEGKYLLYGLFFFFSVHRNGDLRGMNMDARHGYDTGTEFVIVQTFSTRTWQGHDY